MTAVLKSTLLLFAAFASVSARYIDNGFSNDILYDSSGYSQEEVDNVGDIDEGCENCDNFVSTKVSLPAFSSPAAIVQAKATADAISEIAAAKTVRAKAAAQAKLNALRLSAAQLNVKKTQAEADLRYHSAEVHMAKAAAAAERRMQAMAQERSELYSARQDEALSQQLRQAAAQTLRLAEEESINTRKMIFELEREAAVHEARAAAARAKADAIARSAGLPSLIAPTGLSSVSISSEYSFPSDTIGDSCGMSDITGAYDSDECNDSNDLDYCDPACSSQPCS